MLSNYNVKLALQWIGSFAAGMGMAWCIHSPEGYYSYAIVLGITAVVLLVAACVTHEKGR